MWEELLKLEKSRNSSTDISSTIYLSCMKANNEKIEYEDLIKFKLLLYFWKIVIQVYQPFMVKLNRKTQKLERKSLGYVVVIPDVTEPMLFLDYFIEVGHIVQDKEIGENFKIAIPHEAGLNYLSLYLNVLREQEMQKFPNVVANFIIIHLNKAGNNINILFFNSYSTKEWWQKEYKYRNIHKNLKSILFKSQAIDNLVKDIFWFKNFHDLLSRYDIKNFFGKMNENLKFREDIELFFNQNPKTEGEGMKEYQERLPDLVLRMVRKYIKLRTLSKLNYTEKDYESWKSKDKNGKIKFNPKPDYYEERTKVAKNAFLRIKSCKSQQQFVEFFTSIIASQSQAISDTDYKYFSSLLLNSKYWLDIKSLTMLALSKES